MDWKSPVALHDSMWFWLALYFAFNLGLTLYNKSVLVSFPFPYTVTALHALCCSVGGWYLRRRGFYEPAELGASENVALLLFSFLYTINIAVSNVSLHLVTVPFHQVVRAMTPIFTILFSAILLGTRCSRAKLISMLPLITGVGFATYGDYSFTQWGLFLTILGTVLAALKTVFTNLLQTRPTALPSFPPAAKFPAPATPSAPSSAPGLSDALALLRVPRLALHPLDLLTRLSPLAFTQCVLAAHASGELSRVRAHSAAHMTYPRAAALLVNGAIAFGLNVVSFTTNRKAGPVTMSVAANVKQVLTISLAVFLFDLHLTQLNVFGICLSILGGVWYARVEFVEKGRIAGI